MRQLGHLEVTSRNSTAPSLVGSHKRYPSVATSSTEVEYMSLTVILLKRMLSDMKVYPKLKVVIFQGNQGAIALAKSGLSPSHKTH